MDKLQQSLCSEANQQALTVAKMVMENNSTPTFAEIGVGIGSTTRELCKLNIFGQNYLFDYEYILEEVSQKLFEEGFTNIIPVANSRKKLDSYVWSIATLDKSIKFDFVYLDGAHVFNIDAITVVMIKELLNDGGFILLDDYFWSMKMSPTKSPSVCPEILDLYTMEQIETAHIKMICEMFLDTDSRFVEIPLDHTGYPMRRGIAYRKMVLL